MRARSLPARRVNGMRAIKLVIYVENQNTRDAQRRRHMTGIGRYRQACWPNWTIDTVRRHTKQRRTGRHIKHPGTPNAQIPRTRRYNRSAHARGDTGTTDSQLGQQIHSQPPSPKLGSSTEIKTTSRKSRVTGEYPQVNEQT